MTHRINVILTEEAIRNLDKVRAEKQKETVKPLSRPDMVRLAVERFLRKELQ